MIFATTLPIRLVSEANAHEHYRVRSKRARAQGQAVGLVCRVPLRYALRDHGALAVTITRIAPRELDSDNLQGSGKHVRDAVASVLGIDDRDKRVTWIVKQEKGKAKEYAVRIEVAKLGEVACPTCGRAA